MGLLDLIGCAGAVAVPAAYVLTDAPSIRVTARTLATLNLGAGVLAVRGEAPRTARRPAVRFRRTPDRAVTVATRRQPPLVTEMLHALVEAASSPG